MKLMRATSGISALSAVSVLAATAAVAAEGRVAVCAAEQVITCTPYEACERSLPGAVNLPILMRFDTGAQTVLSRTDDGEERVSPISSVTETEGYVILTGVDQDVPWLMRVNSVSGRFVLSSGGPDEAFTAFGACSASLLK